MSIRPRESFGASVNAPHLFEKKAANTAVTTNENCEVVKKTPKSFEIQTADLNEIIGEPKQSKKLVKKTSKQVCNYGKLTTAFCSNQHYPEFHSEELLNYENGTKALPHPVGFMDTVEMSYEQASTAVKIGIPSMDKDGDVLIPVLVVKTSNSYTIFSEDEDGRMTSLIWAMDRIELIKKVKAKDGLVYIDILVTDDFGCKNIRVPMSTFNETSIKSLQKYGIKISPMYYFAMSIYFQKIADKMPMEDASQVIGVLRDTVSPLGFQFNGYTSKDAFVVKNNFASYKDYIAEFNKLLTPSKPLQYLLSATMAAPILTLLQQKYNYDIHSYCINVVGASSTGKTICSRVCASAWTNPTNSNIFSAMLATNNAGLKRLSGRYGVPTFLDEATVMANTKSGEYAYSVYEGCEKGRLNSDCTERASGTWSTIVCMSSETHFHSNRKNQNGGLAVRVHSIEDLEWTVSKEHAEKLNHFISGNYGVLGKRFTKYLFNEKIIDSLEKIYNCAKEKMTDLCSAAPHNFTDRLCATYALTYMTGVMLRKIGVAIDVEAVAEIMVDHHNMVGDEQNIAKNAFNAIVSYVAINGDRSAGIKEYKDYYGRVNKVAVEVQTMDKILSDAGFTDTKVTMKQLAKDGYLIRQVEKGLKSKLTIGNKVCWCYQIDLSSMIPEKHSLKKLIGNNKAELESEDYEYEFDEDIEADEVVDVEDNGYEANEDTEADEAIDVEDNGYEADEDTEADEVVDIEDNGYEANEDIEADEYVDIDWSSIPLTFQSPSFSDSDAENEEDEDEDYND